MVFQALTFSESDCGSKIKGSKKRFVWTFKINKVVNTLELVASFVSGKRRVLHNDREVYLEKEILNVKFEYTHNIENHLFRILQKNNRFELVIDSCPFDMWVANKNKKEVKSKLINFNTQVEKEMNDPFADFGKITKKASTKSGGDHNAFGEFNFDSPAQTTQSKVQSDPFGGFGSTATNPRPSLQKTNSTKVSNDFFTSPHQNSFGDFTQKQPMSQPDIFGNPVQTTTHNPQKPISKPQSNQFNLLDL